MMSNKIEDFRTAIEDALFDPRKRAKLKSGSLGGVPDIASQAIKGSNEIQQMLEDAFNIADAAIEQWISSLTTYVAGKALCPIEYRPQARPIKPPIMESIFIVGGYAAAQAVELVIDKRSENVTTNLLTLTQTADQLHLLGDADSLNQETLLRQLAAQLGP